MTKIFDSTWLHKLYTSPKNSTKGQNGRIVIIGGSKLFHGAPLLALKTASKFVDMVFFASPEPSLGEVADKIKSELLSFVWVPWQEIDEYVAKADAVLIGPGMMRYRKEINNLKLKINNLDGAGKETKALTERFLKKFPEKKWVIDAGSLQTIDPKLIPQNAILTPNKKEYEMLFGNLDPKDAAKKYKCIIVLKEPTTIVYSPLEECKVTGGNAGLTKGGTGDVQAGLTVAFLAKNDPFLAGTAASFLIKHVADELYRKAGTAYNADDLATSMPLYLPQLMR
jgi:NAD(P)H-hydrate epimerase